MSKRRKAAEKKKGQSPTTNNNQHQLFNNNNDNSNPLGNNDPKSQDERESDGGEVNSPASQEHHDQPHPFKENIEELEKRDPSSVRSFDSENKSMEEVTGDVEHAEKVEIQDDDAIKMERELRSEEDSESQIIDIKPKESNDGSSSSSSSSDDESQVVEKKTEEAAYGSVSEAMSRNGENKPVESAYGSISEAISRNGENKPVESLPEEVIQVTEEASFEEAGKSVVDAVSSVDSVKPLVSVTEEVIPVAQSDPVENSLASDVVETRLKEIEESKRSEDKVFPISEDNVKAPSTMVGSIANVNEVKVLPTSDAPIAETSNAAENIRDSKIPDSSENQPLLVSAPRAAERTSWMGCCGLLDVLTGSSR
ncbi:general transcriptional corepressor trfA-like [Pistacia vera]|uniref:general transcriptional corepressor trfA-like n=1 Tax=Pistacia vera TaxID=55513 RepID=UPI00126357EA|nr:general transcriptional corepressor trfA-like [Pistacia vera]